MQLTTLQQQNVQHADNMIKYNHKQAITKLVTYSIMFSLTLIFIYMLDHNNTAVNTLISNN